MSAGDTCAHHVGCPHDVKDEDFGQADLSLAASAAMAHYDDTRSAIADVVAGEDASGIWYAGSVRAGTTPEQLSEHPSYALPDGTPVIWAPQLGRYVTIPQDEDELTPPVQLSHDQANLVLSALEAAQAGATYQAGANRYHELAMEIRAQQAQA